MSKSKTTTKQSSNSTQTAAPPSWTQGGLTQAGSMVQNALGQLPTTHYSGEQVAVMRPEEEAAIRSAWEGTAANAGSMAQNLQNTVMPQLMQQYGFQTQVPTGSYNMGDMYGMNAAIEAAIQPVQQQLMESILPGISSSALSSGAYSSDRAMGVLPQQAVRDSTDSMQRIAATLGYQNYQDYENRRLQAYQGDQATALGAYNAETSRGLGTEQNAISRAGAASGLTNDILRTQASQGDLLQMAANLGVANRQGGIQDALARDQYAAYSPFMGLDQATQLLQGLSGNWGTQTGQSNSTTTQTQQQALGPQLLQAAMGIGSMAMGMPGGLGGLFGGAAAAAPTASSLFGAALPAVGLNGSAINPALFGRG